MPDSCITKRALAESIKELMDKVLLCKISIKDIVENCGLNRQTFYYHFKDKFDLVNWIYYSEAVEAISEYSNIEKWHDGIYKILLYFVDNKSFYINALNTSGQNTFDGYLFDATHDLIMTVINEVSGDMDILEIGKNFIADFYTHAFVGITINWIKSGMKEAPELIADRIRDIVEGSMLRALNRYKGVEEKNK